MKKIVAVVSIVVLALLTIGCENSEEARAREENQREQILQANANRVVEGIQYIKDTRTGLCFAYFWGGSGNGGAIPRYGSVYCRPAATAHSSEVNCTQRKGPD